MPLYGRPSRVPESRLRLHEGRQVLEKPGSRQALHLGESAVAIWRLCNGRRSIEEVIDSLRRRLDIDDADIAADVVETLETLETHGFVTIDRDIPRLAAETHEIDLRRMACYVINCEDDTGRRTFMANQLTDLDLRFEFVAGIKCSPSTIGIGLAHLRILVREDVQTPFAVFEDDCRFTANFAPIHRLPDGVDALYLGHSRFGLPAPGDFGWGEWDGTVWEQYSENYIRVFNMLGRHGIVYLTEAFRQAALEAALKALTERDYVYPGDIAYAMLQPEFLVLTPTLPGCYQAAEVAGNRSATRGPLGRPERFSIHVPRGMKVMSRGDDDFFLFYDLFPHWSRRKLTAVAPHYGGDLDWSEVGIDLDDVKLVFGEYSVTGRCIRHRLDSFEPCIVLDFEHPELRYLMEENDTLEVTVFAGSQHRAIEIDCRPPETHETSLSLIVRNENRWLRYYLDYYLDILKADHIYLYDNQTRDHKGLMDLIRPYMEDEVVTYIPWHHRWKNHADGKQIGQPPQQVHSLNKYGGDRWIGFFDTDEFLRIPGKSLPEFLGQYDSTETGALSFGLKWFMHQGPLEYEDIHNPLLSMLHCRRDRLGRKRQKLFVSPQNVRFMRLHWIQDDQREIPVTEENAFFHHYCLTEERFKEGKTAVDVRLDAYMTQFEQAFDAPPPDKYRFIPKPSGIEAWRLHVERSIERAHNRLSRLEPEVLGVEGMCGELNRHLLNNLCAYSGCRYLEVGSWKGASVCAATYHNNIEAVCVDNWSKFTHRGDPRVMFDAHVSQFCQGSKISLIEKDSFTVDPAALGVFDIFFYDGSHDESDQYRAIEHFLPCLSDPAVILIDDWNRERVKAGTLRALDDLSLSVHLRKEILVRPGQSADANPGAARAGWWNGIGIFLVRKP